MEYFVIGPDGKEYGPASIDTLRQWVAEKRIFPTTMLKNFQTGLSVPASTMTELFPAQPPTQAAPPVNWSQPPTASYPRQDYGKVDDGKADVLWAVVRSAIALVLFFAVHGIGLFVGGYGLYYAIRGHSKGHRLGGVAIAISGATLLIIAIGWALRLGHQPL